MEGIIRLSSRQTSNDRQVGFSLIFLDPSVVPDHYVKRRGFGFGFGHQGQRAKRSKTRN